MRLLLIVVSIVVLELGSPHAAAAQRVEALELRGHAQQLHLYGQRGGAPAIVSSGDGGWIHLGPHLAEQLAARGFFVVGFDVKSYLSAFTTSTRTLQPAEAQQDFRTLIDFAARGSQQRPLLIGVSEGAGLSVLAATAGEIKPLIAGVIGFGLPDINELGWRWKDNIIYLTHGQPDEPTFSTRAIIAQAAPVPIAALHSEHDEYVPVAEIEQVMAAAREPKRLWMITASNHRFSGNIRECDQRLFDAIDWVRGAR